MARCPHQSHCPKRATPSLEMLTRREWVKRFALGTVTALTGEAWKGVVLADIAPGSNPANVLTFDLANYPALQSDYGSIRLNLLGPLIPNGIITITRAPGNVFYSMSAYCTHQGTIVEAYDNTPDTTAMICYGHGSVYNIQGQLISDPLDGQATQLPAYGTAFANNNLRVEIPGLNLKVNSTTLFSVNGATKRLQLSFPAKNGGKYRVRFSPDLTTASTIVGCATSSGGAATTTLINQTANGTRNVWVDSTASTGFYFIEMVIGPYTP